MGEPPRFVFDLPSTDLRGRWLRVECCDRTACLPFRMLAEHRPGAHLGSALRMLRCQACGQRVTRVVLVDNPAEGAARRPTPGGWRIQVAFPDLPVGWA